VKPRIATKYSIDFYVDEANKNHFLLYMKKKKYSWKIRLAANVLSFIISGYIRLLMFTCRHEIYGEELFHEERKKNGGKLLSVSWHRSLIYTMYFFRRFDSTIMSSQSKDGEFITAVLRRLGYYAPRGSSGKGKGGGEALVDFVKFVKKGNVGGLAADAPKGPPYIAKRGILTAALMTKADIIPHMWMAYPSKRIGSWDRTIFPKFFSKIVMVFDRELIKVSSLNSKKEKEEAIIELNNRLNKLAYQVDHWLEFKNQYEDPRDIPVPEPIPEPYHPPKKTKKKK